MTLLRSLLVASLALAACSSPAPAGSQCAFSADCAAGLVCAAGFCSTPCTAGNACPSGTRCVVVAGTAASVCAAITADARCLYASDCAAGLVCNREGRCQPQCRTDYDCRVDNPYATCVSGACSVVCSASTADCDGVARTGCETDTRSSTDHCGACGTVCRAGANQSSTCAAGACTARCDPGFADCDGSAATGCEADTRTSVAHCGGCNRACAPMNATAVCAAGMCGRGACNAGFADCDGDAANGCESNPLSDDANCGGCGMSCATRSTQTGVAHTCQAGQCLPRNDTCATAQAIDLTMPSPIRVTASTRFARVDRAVSCAKTGGPDVWFRLTVTQPEVVYADTLGATWDTALYFASSCTEELPLPSETFQIACSDDVALRCKAGGAASQIYAVLRPGTYYLVLAGVAGDVGEVTVNVQHIPLGNGPAEDYPVGGFKGPAQIFGTLAGTGLTRGTCGGDGPERSYWWATCPGHSSEELVADTCDPNNAAVNTVLYLRHGDGTAETCNDDAPMQCSGNPRGSYIQSMVPGGAGIHALTVDSNGAGGEVRVSTIYPNFNGGEAR